jgi:cytochrome c biogenesis protein
LAKAYNRFIKIFSGVELAVVLFTVLAIIIFIGTTVPQEPLVGRSSLLEKYGLETYNTLRFWRLTDVFHAWWYLALMFLLALNLTVASFKRVFPGYRKATFWPAFLLVPPKDQTEGNFKTKLALNSWQILKERLRKNFWEIKINSTDNSLVARRGAYHRLGPTIVHIGILTILLGAFISLLWGFNGVIQGVPGDRFILSDRQDSKRSYILVTTSPVFHAPLWLGKSPEFEVEVGPTNREDHPDGTPKQWTTELKFFKNDGKEITQNVVSVNHPVSFQGVDFYQADWKRLLKLNFNEQNFEIKLDKIKDAEVAFTSVTPELGLIFLLPQNAQNLKLISLKGKLSSQVFKDPIKLVASGYLKPLASLSPSQAIKLGPMKFRFVGAFSQSGIQYKHSPGDGLMIIGMSILVLGVMVAFGHKRVIWAIKDPEQNAIFVIGNSDRARDLFKAEFKSLIETL